LASVARVLPKGGRFGIDLVPDLPAWDEYRNRKTLSGTMGRDTRVELVETVRQDSVRRLTIFDQHYTTRRGGQRREHRFQLTFRTLTVPQMAARLERAGFIVDAVLGDYLGGPWDLRADVWVLLARRRERAAMPGLVGRGARGKISGHFQASFLDFPGVFAMSGHSKWHTI